MNGTNTSEGIDPKGSGRTAGWQHAHAAALADRRNPEPDRLWEVVDLPDGGGTMYFRHIPPGSFLMGERHEPSAEDSWYRRQVRHEEPRHVVRVTQSFLMAVFPVTQAQFDAYVTAEKLNHSHPFPGDPRLPAGSVSWNDAVSFCQWMNETVSLPRGWTASLPTESEWEYACRAGTTTEFHAGDGEVALEACGWFRANSGVRSEPVGALAPNAFDLYDMHGNVWEWCLDRFDSNAYRDRANGVDAAAARRRALEDIESTSFRVLRGGSWIGSAGSCRSAYRGRSHPGFRVRAVGFRVCLLPGPLVPSQTDQTGCGAAQADEGGGGGTPPEP